MNHNVYIYSSNGKSDYKQDLEAYFDYMTLDIDEKCLSDGVGGP